MIAASARDPRDKVKHSWRCTRRHPVVETIERGRLVYVCTGCQGTDKPPQKGKP